MSNEMEEYGKKQALKFFEYQRRFRTEEGYKFKKECERLGGIFSLADYGNHNIYDDMLNGKPIVSHMYPDGQWEFHEDKLRLKINGEYIN